MFSTGTLLLLSLGLSMLLSEALVTDMLSFLADQLSRFILLIHSSILHLGLQPHASIFDQFQFDYSPSNRDQKPYSIIGHWIVGTFLISSGILLIRSYKMDDRDIDFSAPSRTTSYDADICAFVSSLGDLPLLATEPEDRFCKAFPETSNLLESVLPATPSEFDVSTTSSSAWAAALLSFFRLLATRTVSASLSPLSNLRSLSAFLASYTPMPASALTEPSPIDDEHVHRVFGIIVPAPRSAVLDIGDLEIDDGSYLRAALAMEDSERSGKCGFWPELDQFVAPHESGRPGAWYTDEHEMRGWIFPGREDSLEAGSASDSEGESDS